MILQLLSAGTEGFAENRKNEKEIGFSSVRFVLNLGCDCMRGEKGSGFFNYIRRDTKPGGQEF